MLAINRMLFKRQMLSHRHVDSGSSDTSVSLLNSSNNHIRQSFSNTVKLRNLYIERLHRKMSNSPMRLATEGDLDEGDPNKSSVEDKNFEFEKLKKIEREWKVIKSNLNSSNDSIKHCSNACNVFAKSDKSVLSPSKLTNSNKSLDEVCIEDSNENACVQFVKLFKTNNKHIADKKLLHVVPITKISLHSSGIYITTRTSDGLMAKAKLASCSVERGKNFSYPDAKNMLEESTSPRIIPSTSSYRQGMERVRELSKPRCPKENIHKRNSMICKFKEKNMVPETRETNTKDHYRNLLLDGIKKCKP